VERLYGQRPFVELTNSRCESCSHCSVKGCIDLAPSKSIAPAIAAARNGHWWLSPFGVFAAAFPGFVLAYYLIPDGPLGSAPAVYGQTALWIAASYGVTALVSRVFRVRAARAMPVLAAAAAGLYYWFASPVFAAAIHLPADGMILALRTVFLGLVAIWFLRASVVTS
jgi:hypothetical protein